MLSVIGLMAAFLGAWAILGVSLFEGLVEEALQDNVGRIGFFDSHGEAMITLVQMLMGEGWHEVTFAVLNARGSFVIFWYFGLVRSQDQPRTFVCAPSDSATVN